MGDQLSAVAAWLSADGLAEGCLVGKFILRVLSMTGAWSIQQVLPIRCTPTWDRAARPRTITGFSV